MSREFPQAPLVGVAGVVIRDAEVLLIKRKYEPMKGEWSLPGGLLELGETMREGVTREVFEETGLGVRPVAVVDVLDAIHREDGRVKYHYVLVDFLCELVAGDLVTGDLRAATDALEARWVNREHATSDGEYHLANATALIIEKAFQLAQAASAAPS